MTHLVTDEERQSLIAGLQAAPPRLSPRYFYDDAGSKLFARITATPEYYPTRTELSILRDKGKEIAKHIRPGSVVVELGSGSGDKVLALLSHLERPRAYRPIDISKTALVATERAVRSSLPDLDVLPFEGDFTDAAAYESLPEGAPICVYYSGSTIGNFDPPDAIAFLSALRARLEPGDTLLLAADLVKDTKVLDAAYNDAQGVTAAFNRNILRHLNSRFDGDFDPEQFDHRATYVAKKRRIEMHLVARSRQEVTVAGQRFEFVPELSIHTESSYKFDFDGLESLARSSGFRLLGIVTDDRRWFAEAILEVA